MLKAIELENFKPFGELTRIELAPITLFFGENSAGKSSILQALNLLKQTLESREGGAALMPRTEEGIVDLGSFTELIFDHDIERKLRIGLDVVPRDPRRWRRIYPFHTRAPSELTLGLRLDFRRSKQTREVYLSDFSLHDRTAEKEIARFQTRRLSEEEQRSLYRFGSAPYLFRGRRRTRRQRITGAQCNWVSDDQEIWEPYYRAWHAQRDSVVKSLEDESFLRADRHRLMHESELDQSDSVEQMNQRYKAATSFYARDFSIDEFVDRMLTWCKSSVVAMDSFIPIAAPALTRRDLAELALSDVHRPRRPLKSQIIDVGQLAFVTGRLVEEELDALFPMGPFRRPPERWYMFTGTSPSDVGYRGDHLPDLLFRRPELVEKANRWLTKLEIGYQLRVQPVEEIPDLFEVRLLDGRRDTDVVVSLSDVGFGVSQLLPFIVQILASERQIISIEQPEVHVHPKLQADLGELIAEAIGEPYQHQFLIETHSEHLVLRLQKLVRSGDLKPADVAVNYVSRGPTGSRVERLLLNDAGEFIDEWPGGFFPERLRELQ